MSRPNRTYRRRTAETDDAILAAGWREYMRVFRSIAASNGWRLRALANSSRVEDDAQMLAWGTMIERTKHAATRGWLAACRRVHSGVQVIPVGTTKCGLPTCFVVRIPQTKSMVLREVVMGQAPRDDAGARVLLGGLKQAEAKERMRVRQEARVGLLYAKMVEALTAARREHALKARALQSRAGLDIGAARLEHTREAYRAHAEHRRKWQMAKAYQSRLAQLGYQYDFMNIDTPIQLD